MRLAPLLALVALAGCLGPFTPLSGEPGATHWSFDVEPSMAPTFPDAPDGYPVLLVHTHVVPSQRQQDEQRRNPVVCLTLAGAPAELEADPAVSAAAAPCPGPPADVATGRVFAPRGLLDDRRADALAIRMDACGGGLVTLGDGFVVQTQEHAFRVEKLPNGTFRVDDRWIAPGSALKVGYYVRYGSGYDQSFVRVVFDAPGAWRRSMISPYDPDVDGARLARPDQGDGHVVDVPLAPASPRAPLELVAAATPGARGVLEMRLVHDGARLTEATFTLQTDQGAFTWYGAGRTGDTLRLLGAPTPPRAATPVDAARLARAFDVPWSALRGNGTGITDVRLASSVTFATAGVAPLGMPGAAPCVDPCVHVRREDAWDFMLAPQQMAADGAFTLRVSDAERASWWVG